MLPGNIDSNTLFICDTMWWQEYCSSCLSESGTPPGGLRWRALDRLGKMGFDVELLASKKNNLKVLRRLKPAEIDEVKSIIIREFVAEKFRSPSLRPLIVRGNLVAMATTLKGMRIHTTYLIWKNPSFRHYPDPLLPNRVPESRSS